MRIDLRYGDNYASWLLRRFHDPLDEFVLAPRFTEVVNKQVDIENNDQFRQWNDGVDDQVNA